MDQPQFDAEGYLSDPAQWSPAIAEELARRESIVLTGEHWVVIRFMREFHEEHQVAADARFAIKALGEHLGPGVDARRRMFELFPYGYVRQACKIAGMRRPRAWSTG